MGNGRTQVPTIYFFPAVVVDYERNFGLFELPRILHRIWIAWTGILVIRKLPSELVKNLEGLQTRKRRIHAPVPVLWTWMVPGDKFDVTLGLLLTNFCALNDEAGHW
jgi:hypothetical protein